MGPIATAHQFEKVKEMIARALADGAVAACGGGADEKLGGYFIKPTVLTNVKPGDYIMREEVFGPVVCMMPFDTEEEGIALGE